MDSLIGFVGADYVMLLADTSQARSILKLKGNEDKIFALDENKVIAHAGPQGDRENYAQFLQKNLALYKFRSGAALSTEAAANFARSELAKVLFYLILWRTGSEVDKEGRRSAPNVAPASDFFILVPHSCGNNSYFILFCEQTIERGGTLGENWLPLPSVSSLSSLLSSSPPSLIIAPLIVSGPPSRSLPGQPPDGRLRRGRRRLALLH